jgi:autotransporter translocation and assembly factor TamB
MTRSRGRLRWGATAVVVICIVALALWKWQDLARFAIVTAADATLHVRLSFGSMTLGLHQAVLDDVRIESRQHEPIAEMPRFSLAYDLRDLLPGGKRLFGLRSIEAESPHVTIIRRPDGSYNIPIPQFQANRAKAQPPLIALVRVRDGSISVVDQRRQALTGERRLYVAGLYVDADISMAGRSSYAADLHYGERPDRLYSVRGRGEIDTQRGYIDHHWTAAELPVASAVNFIADSTSLSFLAGTLRHLDARYVGFTDEHGRMYPHIVASGDLAGGSIAIAGLSKPVEAIRGPVDVYSDGLMTPRLDASLAGTPVAISGGLFGVRSPHLRIAIRGSGESAQLRSAFAQARHLPISGPLRFALLVEGSATKPVAWIDLQAPHLKYALTSVQRLNGLVAFEGQEADVIGLGGAYRTLDLGVRGRAAFEKRPGAVEMLLRANAPANGIPYASTYLPRMDLHATALATSNDPKAIALNGALWGSSPSQTMDAVFNVDNRGKGSVGPLHLTSGSGSLYARLALDRPRNLNLGVVEAREFPLAPAHAMASGTVFGGQTSAGTGIGLTTNLRGSWGEAYTQGRLALRKDALTGALFGTVANAASFGAKLAGTLQSPQIAGTIVVAGERYRNFAINGNAGAAYAAGTVQLRDAAISIGPLFVGVAGTISGLVPKGLSAMRYNLTAQLHSSDVGGLLATVQPKTAKLIQGSLDANVHVRGAGLSPAFAGTMSSPEGTINGLALRDLRGHVSGNSNRISLNGGHVLVGSTALALQGSASRTGSAAAEVNAPYADLADFNDFFDSGDTFAGSGRLALRAALKGRRLISSSGNVDFAGTRFRRIDLGNLTAHWQSHARAVVAAVRFGGATGEIILNGNVMPDVMGADLRATAHAVDLGTWLPMLGLTFPITGHLDAQTTLSGRYPDIAMHLRAAIFGGTAGRLPIERFEVTASTLHGRGTIQSAVLDVPELHTVASGTFGLRPSDAFALTAHSTSSDVGAFLRGATGKDVQIGGTLDSLLRLEGTRSAPRLRDAITLQSLQYGALVIPRVTGEIDVDRHSVALQNGELDLARGRALLSALVPIHLTTPAPTLGSGPISATLRAENIELSNFLTLLPKGTKIDGRIDGTVDIKGTATAPELLGSLTLRGGSFSGPMERTPITDIGGDLSFMGKSAQLQSSGSTGGGMLRAQATASLASLQRLADSTLNVHASATNARLNLPDYFNGILDADVSLSQAGPADPAVSGRLSVSKARIPVDAFLNQKGGANASSRLPNLAFNGFRIAAGPDVRVQSRNIDIGAAGNAVLGGSLDKPTLSGSFSSTGGSLNFYRSFNLERGTLSFARSSGIVPDVDAVATTFVSNPPTAIRLHVTGPVTGMNLELASDPVYSREQILGILVGAQQFGAVQGVQASSQPFSATQAATNIALGQVNTLFTRNLLQPLSTSLAGSLGFTEVNITSDLQTGIGVSAVKAFGKYLRAVFFESFGYPRVQSFSLESNPSDRTGLRATLYTAQGPTVLSLQQPQPVGMDVMNLNPLTAFTPVGGTNGFAFSYLRKF